MDTFWDDIDKMLDNESPFAPYAQIPMVDNEVFPSAPPPPKHSLPLPNVHANVETVAESAKPAICVAPSDFGAKSTRTLTMERSLSFQVDIVKSAIRAAVEKCGSKITLTRFKKEAIRAWERKYPNYIGRTNKFQVYVKTHMKDIRHRNPTMTHSEHMKLIGRMWKDLPAADKAASKN